MQGLELLQGAHVPARGEDRFTKALVQVLQRAGLLQQQPLR